ncbi:hypothetical protein FIBSPDRAFT_931462 [Athelia psychrophila]|uniref:Reverse transcriptase domain-containing protein n=1 Tax=Athelia psychrophila TaxID=1759441 RepID=A0A166K8W8_9AGAM|nr:hypothetical protein FIBSPDRAFT_931462 [Fibularhizoctonia sp. CBS 109695]
MADFRPPGYEDDVILGGIPLRAIIQRRLNYLWNYSAVKSLVINMAKTLAMIYGAILRGIAPFTLDGKPVDFTNEYSDDSMTFVSDARNIFAHYTREEKSARFIASVTFNVKSFVGTLPPFQGKRLYNAQMILAVRYLQYVLSRPADHLFACALCECSILYSAGAQNWLGDLGVVINLIPINWTRPTWSPLGLDVASATPLIDDITMAVKLHVQDAIDMFPKGLLLRGRLYGDENGATVTEPLAYRLYLTVTALEHRKALTSLLLADSSLAKVHLRYMDVRGRRKQIPREWRYVASVWRILKIVSTHCWHVGRSNELINLRAIFWNKCGPGGELMGAIRTLAPKDIICRMLLSKCLVPILAVYSPDVLEVFEKVAMFIASKAYWYGKDALEDKRPRARQVKI